MKKILLGCCLALFTLAPSVMACGHHHGDLLSQLGLTDAQKAQIAQIRQSTEPHKVKPAEILAVLTPTQKAEWKQLHA